MRFDIVTARETFTVEADGSIGRPAIGMAASGQWKAVALIRRNNLGTLETIPFAQWADKIATLQWRFKNGKPRYTLRDLDHGTMREWGNNVLRVYVRRDAAAA